MSLMALKCFYMKQIRLISIIYTYGVYDQGLSSEDSFCILKENIVNNLIVLYKSTCSYLFRVPRLYMYGFVESASCFTEGVFFIKLG